MAAPCGRCAQAEGLLASAQAELMARSSEVADVRASLQAARERESGLQAELAVLKEAMAVQDWDSKAKLDSLEFSLRSLYKASLRHAPAVVTERLDVKGVVEEVTRRVAALLEQEGAREQEIGKLQAELSQARTRLSTQEFLHNAALSEVEAARDAQARSAAAAATAAQEQLQTARASYEAQVSSLRKQLAELEGDMQRQQTEFESRELQMKEYSATLEVRLGHAQEEARVVEDHSAEAAQLRKQVSLLRGKIEKAYRTQENLDAVREERDEKIHQLSVLTAQIQQLEPKLASAERHIVDQSALLETRGKKLLANETGLQDMHRKLEASQANQRSLQQLLSAAQHELHILHSQHHALQAAYRELQSRTPPGSGGGVGDAEGSDEAGSTRTSQHLSVPPQTPSRRQPASAARSSDLSDSGLPAGGSGSGAGAGPWAGVGRGAVGTGGRSAASSRRGRGAAGDMGEEEAVEDSGGDAGAGAPLSMFNDGTYEGLLHENKVLRERLADLQATLTSWDASRYQAEQELIHARDLALSRAEVLSRQLSAAAGQEASVQATAAELAAEVARLQQALERERARAEAAERSAAETHHALHAAEVAQRQRDVVQGLLDAKIVELQDVTEQRDARLTLSETAALRDQLKDTQEKLTISKAEVADLRAAAVEYESAITELEELSISFREQLEAAQVARDDMVRLVEEAESARAEAEQRIDSLDGPQGPSARAAALEAALMQERQLHSALKAQMPGLLQALEQTKQELAARESEALRLDGTANILRAEMIRMQQANGHF